MKPPRRKPPSQRDPKRPFAAVMVQPDPAALAAISAALLDEGGRLRPLTAAEYAGFPRQQLQLWCGLNARYLLPTVELVEWLRARIAGRKALEIGAGMGDLGRLLGVPMTDSALQVANPVAVAYYALLGQRPTDPPGDVERLDAHAAIARHKPEVVVGAWITHRWVPGSPKGNMFGPIEEDIVRDADYIHVGNWNVHGEKPVLRLPHETHTPPGIVSRAADESRGVVWIWRTG